MEEIISKSLVRKTILDHRRQLGLSDFDLRNDLICSRLKELLSKEEAQTFHVFLPIQRNKEPDVSCLFAWLWDRGVEIIVSQTDFERRTMKHFLLKPETQFLPNRLGIPEPVGAEEVTLDSIQVILVPLVLADKHGNRIGYGGGFYDQLLSETNAVKVGLSLSPPVDLIMQRDKWDIPLNHLITPNKTYHYG